MGNIFLYILSALIALFTIFLLIVYIKSHLFKSYPCYFNIYFCFIITLDNIIRLIPADINQDPDRPSAMCKAQAFILSTFDKLFVTSITSFSIINYIIMINMELYVKFTSMIYIISVIISICLSIILSTLFFIQGISHSSLEDSVCYVKTSGNVKIITDTIFTGILLLIDLFCITRILITIFKYIKKYESEGNQINKEKMKSHFWRFLLDLFLNILTFGFLILLINKKLSFSNEKKFIKDSIYIILCFFCELFFTMNGQSYKAIMNIITCNRVEKYKNPQNLLQPTTEEEDNDD